MKGPSNSNPFVIKKGSAGRGVFTNQKVNKGTILFKMHGLVVNKPTQTSVQIGEDMHIEDALAGYVNHNCKPSARVDRATQSFVSTRDIEKGEEITFDYTQNEDQMASPFKCACCGKLIKGKVLEQTD